MYGMVLMAAMTGAGDTTSFGDKGGCTGSCTGSHHHLFGGGGCHGGIFGLRHTHSCHGGSGCTGYYAGCTGSAPVVVAPPAPVTPAPVVMPAPVAAPAACCPAPTCCPAPAKKHCGLLGGLKKSKHCCSTPAPVVACCPAPPAVVVPPANPVPTPMKPVDKKPGTGD